MSSLPLHLLACLWAHTFCCHLMGTMNHLFSVGAFYPVHIPCSIFYIYTHTHTHTYIGHAVRHVGFYFSHCCSVAKGCLTLCNPMDCSVPSFPVLYHLPEFAQTHVHWVSDDIWPFHPLPPPSPFALNLSQHQGLFQWVSSSHQVARYWSFSCSISPSNEHSGLISFRIDWFDLADLTMG